MTLHNIKKPGVVQKLSDPIEIIINSILGTQYVNSENTKAICFENTDVTLSGELLIPDRKFVLPIRRDDGRLFLFEAEVINGEFNVIVNFPTVGEFMYSNKEANKDISTNTFNVETLRFDVIRKSV